MEEELETYGITWVKSLRCTNEDPIHCGSCEACLLKARLESTKEWFPRLSSNDQQLYVIDLLEINVQV